MTEEKKALRVAERAAQKLAKQEARRKMKLLKSLTKAQKVISKAISKAEKVQSTLATDLDKALVIFEIACDSLKPPKAAVSKKAAKPRK